MPIELPLGGGRQEWRRVGRGLLVAGVVTIAVAIPLSLHTRSVFQDQSFERTVRQAIDEWDPGANVEELDADAFSGGASVTLAVRSDAPPAPTWELAEFIARDWGGPIEVTVFHTLQSSNQAVVD